MNGSTIKTCSELVLAIELSNPSASPDAHAVALFSLETKKGKSAGESEEEYNASLIGSLPIGPTMRSSESLMVLVETLCAEHKVSPGDLTRIIVSIGPGGYTALRISTTTAKVLAHTLGCALVAVPTALVAAHAIESDHCPGLIVLASKNQQGHCVVVHGDGSVETAGVLGVGEAGALVDAHGVRSVIADAHLPSSFVQRAQELGVEICPMVLDARYVLKAAQGIEPIDPVELMPIYAREPDAITQWRARGDARPDSSPSPSPSSSPSSSREASG